MAKSSLKNPYTGKSASDALHLEELIQAISDSALSEGKKMAYLYLIASGEFSMDHMRGLQEDMNEARKKLQRKAKYRQKKLSKTDADIAKLEHEIGELTPQATQEVKENLDKLMTHIVKTNILPKHV